MRGSETFQKRLREITDSIDTAGNHLCNRCWVPWKDVNVRKEKGRTLLHDAAILGRPECVKALIRAGADAAITDNYRYTPLHYVTSSTGCCALLIQAYPQGCFSLNSSGRTPLHTVAVSAAHHVCKMLLDAGCVVDVVDFTDCTPLYLSFSCVYGYDSYRRAVSELLLDHGAKFENLKYKSTLQPPHWARLFVARRIACRASCWAMLKLAKQRSPLISGNGRDVLGLLAREIWKTRKCEAWALDVE